MMDLPIKQEIMDEEGYMSVEMRPGKPPESSTQQESQTGTYMNTRSVANTGSYSKEDEEEENDADTNSYHSISTMNYSDLGAPSISDEAMIEFARNNYAPYYDEEGNTIVDVDCGGNKAQLYVNKLCQGSKGLCIFHRGNWYTPNEYQSFCGRETAKDWKRSIRHRGKSLKILMARGLLSTHHSSCDCPTCRFQLTKARFDCKRPTLIDPNSLTTRPSEMEYVTTSSSAVEFVTLSNGRKRNGETDGPLSSIINNLHQANNSNVSDSEENSGSVDGESRKRGLLAVDDGNPQKRSRSTSPVDDIYDQEQRKIYQAANSPEPQKIENVRQSLAGDRSESSSPIETLNIITSTPANALHKSRKQISPHHIELQQVNLNIPHNRTPQTAARRYHTRGGQDRGHPSSSSGHMNRSGPMKMIALTRPDSANFSRTTNNMNHHRSHSRSIGSIATTSQPEDITDWTVDDVSNFVGSLRGCEEYASVFKDQGIDGEILSVLTEDHLLSHMGLKLGPALKIRLRVAKKLGYTLDGQYGHLSMSHQLQQIKPESTN